MAQVEYNRKEVVNPYSLSSLVDESIELHHSRQAYITQIENHLDKLVADPEETELRPCASKGEPGNLIEKFAALNELYAQSNLRLERIITRLSKAL